jgi:CheY-like chemotaxis protein
MTDHKPVLVVDDDAETRRLLDAALSKRGLAVDLAGDGAEALERIRRVNYAVVLLDLLMPGMSGFTVLDELQKPDVHPPVVLVISGADRSVIDRLDPLQVHGIIRKPFDPEDLASVVVACADIRSRTSFGTMALATMFAGGQLLDWLNRFRG